MILSWFSVWPLVSGASQPFMDLSLHGGSLFTSAAHANGVLPAMCQAHEDRVAEVPAVQDLALPRETTAWRECSRLRSGSPEAEPEAGVWCT